MPHVSETTGRLKVCMSQIAHFHPYHFRRVFILTGVDGWGLVMIVFTGGSGSPVWSLNLFEPRLAESHSTVVVRFDNRVLVVSLLNCTHFPGWHSKVAQTFDANRQDLGPARIEGLFELVQTHEHQQERSQQPRSDAVEGHERANASEKARRVT
jgi:hypothetical protein